MGRSLLPFDLVPKTGLMRRIKVSFRYAGECLLCSIAEQINMRNADSSFVLLLKGFILGSGCCSDPVLRPRCSFAQERDLPGSN
jgi:hypothetical protein